MSHDPFEARAAAYAAGALEGNDLAEFQRHLAQGCERCARLVRESEEALARGAAPPPRLRPEPRRRPWLAVAAAAAAVVAGAAFTSAWVAARYEARLGQMAREFARSKQALVRQESTLRDELAAARGVVELLRDPATRVVELRGLGPSPAAAGRVVWNEERGGHVFVANLPPAPAGNAYELWTIAGGAPRPAGLVRVDAEGRGSARIEPAGGGRVQAFAATLEPEAGGPAPTGPTVLASR